MMRSMFSGVSGLRIHQTRMDVIGNNIANVNTTGYKSSRVTFNDVFNQTIRGASRPDRARNIRGINPMQIGLGAGLASIDQMMTTGAAQRTDWVFDLMIEGEGFFVVSDDVGNNFFTRAGAFRVDEAGNITTPGGLAVMGWQRMRDPVTHEWIINSPSRVVPLVITPEMNFSDPEPTFMIEMAGNLNVIDGADEGFTKQVAFYDSIGTRFIVDATYTFDNATQIWRMELASEAALASHPDRRFPLPKNFVIGPYDATRNDPVSDEEIWESGLDRVLYLRFDEFGNLTHVTPSTAAPTMPTQAQVLAMREAQQALRDRNSALRTLRTAIDNAVRFETGGPAANIPTALPPPPAALPVPPEPPGYWIYAVVPGTGDDPDTDTKAPFIALIDDEIRDNEREIQQLLDALRATALGALGNREASTEVVLQVGSPFDLPEDVYLPNSDFGEILVLPDGRVTNSQIRFDFSPLVQRGGRTNANATYLNGNRPGELQNFAIGEDGILIGIYSNGRTEVLGQLVITQFRNPAGLEKVGGSIFRATVNSGQFDGVGMAPGTEGTRMLSGVLEMSNVDLSNEFTDMIITQRGFQSNSRIITTSDEMLLELVNLKR